MVFASNVESSTGTVRDLCKVLAKQALETLTSGQTPTTSANVVQVKSDEADPTVDCGQHHPG